MERFIFFEFSTESMFGFGKKKKKTHLTDLERELALQTRLENKRLRDYERKLKMLEMKKEELELQADIDEIKEDMGLNEGAFGIGQEELQLLNLLTGGKLSQGLGSIQQQQQETNVSPPTEQQEEGSPSLPSSVLDKLPKPILEKLRSIPKEDLHAFIEQL